MREEFQAMVDHALSRKDVYWYENVLSVINTGAEPIRFKDKDTKERKYEFQKEITVEAAMKLGLQHFLNVPSSRGYKMNLPTRHKMAKGKCYPFDCNGGQPFV